jgi:hypothetical protein
MGLPRVTLPTHSIPLPGLKKTVKYRPYVTREEKLLLMASQSEDPKQMADATLDMVAACILTPGIDVRQLAPFDIDLLFINIRAKSVGEVVDIRFLYPKCPQDADGCVQRVSVDLTSVTAEIPEGHERKFKITDTIGVEMRYPSTAMIERLGDAGENEIETNMRIAAACIASIWEGDSVFIADQCAPGEVAEFLESLPKSALSKIVHFFETMPKIEHRQTICCGKCGANVEFVAKGMPDFFQSASAETL